MADAEQDNVTCTGKLTRYRIHPPSVLRSMSAPPTDEQAYPAHRWSCLSESLIVAEMNFLIGSLRNHDSTQFIFNLTLP